MSVGCQMRHFQLTPLLGFDILQELYFLHQQYFFRLPVTFYNVISFTPSGFWSCKSIMSPKPLRNSFWILKLPDLTRYFTNSWFHIKSKVFKFDYVVQQFNVYIAKLRIRLKKLSWFEISRFWKQDEASQRAAIISQSVFQE